VQVFRASSVEWTTALIRIQSRLGNGLSRWTASFAKQALSVRYSYLTYLRSKCSAGACARVVNCIPPNRLRVQDATFASGGISLALRLVERPGSKPALTVILVHGSENTAAIDHNPWQWKR
jgi:hypothetical protein